MDREFLAVPPPHSRTGTYVWLIGDHQLDRGDRARGADAPSQSARDLAVVPNSTADNRVGYLSPYTLARLGTLTLYLECCSTNPTVDGGRVGGSWKTAKVTLQLGPAAAAVAATGKNLTSRS